MRAKWDYFWYGLRTAHYREDARIVTRIVREAWHDYDWLWSGLVVAALVGFWAWSFLHMGGR